jgi:hypothetical protein
MHAKGIILYALHTTPTTVEIDRTDPAVRYAFLI